MNSIQIIIVCGLIALIIFTLAYYWYKEAKFKKLVENNFNQKTGDTILETKAVIFEAVNEHIAKPTPDKVIQKDIHKHTKEVSDDALFASDELNLNNLEIEVTVVVEETPVAHHEDPMPDDSREAFFVNLDKIDFPFSNEINPKLDIIFDIVFEEPQKIKSLPDIAQYAQKQYAIYILEPKAGWIKYEKRGKHTINAIKIKIELVDKDGLINQAQIENIYNQLYSFVLQYHGHIRNSNYHHAITEIQNYLAHLDEIELVLQLYLVLRDATTYNNLHKFLQHEGLKLEDGYFLSTCGDEINFVIADENDQAFKSNQTYSMLSLNASLHFHSDPRMAIDCLFDFAEKFMGAFDSRILSSNKQVFSERDYESLDRHINSYLTNAKKNGLVLGSDIIYRLL